MDNENIVKNTVRRFDYQSLRPRVGLLYRFSDKLRAKKTLKDFDSHMSRMLLPVLKELEGLIEESNLKLTVERLVVQKALQRIITSFNNALPLDYPYVFAMILVRDNAQKYLGTLRRKEVPGIHDSLHKDMWIVACFDSEKDKKAYYYGDVPETATFEIKSSINTNNTNFPDISDILNTE